MHCQDLYLKGSTTDGVYLVYPDNEEPIKVLCDMTIEGVDGQSFKDEWMDQCSSTWDGKTTEWDLAIRTGSSG